jgi:exonuclease VII small subunit
LQIGSVIEEFGPYFVKYPLRALFDDIVASKGYGSGLNETIYKEEVLAAITAALESLDDTIPPLPLEDIVNAFSKGADWTAACELFLAKFEEHQDNGQVPKPLAVKLATDAFVGPALAVITDRLTVLISAVRNQLLECGSRDLDDTILTDAIIQTVGTVRMYVRGGGIKRVLYALFNLLDADNNGIMTREEVTALWRAGTGMYAFLVAGGSKQDLLPRIQAVLGALWILADADGNGVLSIEELYGVSVKAFDFLLEGLEASLHMAKHVLACVALPSFLLAFDLKAKVLGSSPYEVSVKEVKQICALLGC